MSHHVIIGASNGSGLALAWELRRRGRNVRAVSRSGGGDLPPDVERVRADATDGDVVRRAAEGAEVIYHCANVPYREWPEVLPKLAEASIAGASAVGARLVVMDNLYMYGQPDGPMTESTPRRATGPKGRLRADLEERFMHAHREGRARVAIARASDFFGPHTNSAVSILAVEPLRAGRTASWPGSLDAPHTLNYIDDVAWGLAELGERDEAMGEIWHLPAAEAVTGREFIQMVAEALGRPPKMRALGRTMMRLGGLVNPQAREAVEVLYQFEAPFVMDASKFARAFGARISPMREAIGKTVAAK
jgi:nucleoside-diphosphate-sugar epimerase